MWHGAGWTFILWGGLHGFYLASNHVWRQWKKPSRLINLGNQWFIKMGGCLLTFLCVVIGWVIFRAKDVKTAGVVLQRMFSWNSLSSFEIDGWMWGSLLFLLFIVWVCPNTQQIMERFDPVLNMPKTSTIWRFWRSLRWCPNWAWAVVFAIISVVSLTTVIFSNVKEFLYFQF
jgi:hypothetical protein